MLLIGNGKVITRDKENPYLPDGAVVTDGSVIREVGPLKDLKEKYPEAEFVDAKGGVIMHPLPRRDEIATCCDHDPRAMYWRQMRNGMWIRSALIATTFGLENEILNCGY